MVSSHKHIKFVNSIINSKDQIFNLIYVRCISAGHSTYGIINIIMVPVMYPPARWERESGFQLREWERRLIEAPQFWFTLCTRHMPFMRPRIHLFFLLILIEHNSPGTCKETKLKTESQHLVYIIALYKYRVKSSVNKKIIVMKYAVMCTSYGDLFENLT